jgi:hypothetical protein
MKPERFMLPNSPHSFLKCRMGWVRPFVGCACYRKGRTKPSQFIV